MYQMTDDERSRLKALHSRIRHAMHEAAERGGQTHRYALLLWGFVRGFPYRRIERSHHVQLVDSKPFEHNLPSSYWLHTEAKKYLPELTEQQIKAWLSNPDGAIPAPAPRAKRPYIPAVAAE